MEKVPCGESEGAGSGPPNPSPQGNPKGSLHDRPLPSLSRDAGSQRRRRGRGHMSAVRESITSLGGSPPLSQGCERHRGNTNRQREKAPAAACCSFWSRRRVSYCDDDLSPGIPGDFWKKIQETYDRLINPPAPPVQTPSITPEPTPTPSPSATPTQLRRQLPSAPVRPPRRSLSPPLRSTPYPG